MDNRISAGRAASSSSRVRSWFSSKAEAAVARRRALAGAVMQTMEPRQMLSAAPVVEIEWKGVKARAVENSYVVKVKAGVDFTKVAARNGFTEVSDLGGNGFYSFTSDKAVKQVERWGDGNDNVEALQPNLSVHAATTLPTDTYFQNQQQWNLRNLGQTLPNFFGNPQQGTPGADISAVLAWDIATGPKPGQARPTIAVLDSGMDITHPDLAANVWQNPGESGANATNGIDDDGNGFIDDVNGWSTIDNSANLIDLNGHGTGTAGIAGAVGNNGIGISGVIWDVNIIPVKVLGADGGGTTASIVRGLQYIAGLKNLYNASGGTLGANIVAANLSLGTDFLFPYDPVEARAFQRIGDVGILAVVAAGNGGPDGLGDNIDVGFSFPGKLSLNLPNVISVAATDNQDQLSYFSNFGPQAVQLAAPGESIPSTASRVALNIDTNGDGVGDLASGAEYGSASGTSEAAPHVTGAIALMKAVYPNATAEQLKAALFSSVDIAPLLARELSGQPKVATSGRLNLYRALRAIQSQYERTDTWTKGNWIGSGQFAAYGREAAFVAGESTVLPAGVTILNGSPQVFADSSKDAAALQKPTNPADRIAAGLTSAGTMVIDFDFGTATKLVTVYMADLDNAGRIQRFELYDPTTGQTLSGEGVQNVGAFRGGQYLTYRLTGHVQMRVTSLAGGSAIVNGIFIDAPPTNPQALVGTEAGVGGDWRSTVGGQGAFVAGETRTFPPFVNVNVVNAATGVANAGAGKNKAAKKSAKNDPALLESAANPANRVQTYYSTTGSMFLDMQFTDGLIHQTTFYVADVGAAGRAERIDIISPENPNVILASADVSDFAGGKYVTFDLSGHVVARVSRLAGPDAVLQGVFFDAPSGAKAHYLGINSTAGGNWKGNFGAGAAYVVGATAATLPIAGDDQTLTITTTNAITQILSATTNDTTALQAPTIDPQNPRGNRVQGRLASRTGLGMDLNFSDESTRRIAVYMVDKDTKNRRAQIVQVLDPATNQVLAQQLVANFSGGKYFVFEARGDVRVQVTRVAGPTAVVSGVFVE